MKNEEIEHNVNFLCVWNIFLTAILVLFSIFYFGGEQIVYKEGYICQHYTGSDIYQCTDQTRPLVNRLTK